MLEILDMCKTLCYVAIGAPAAGIIFQWAINKLVLMDMQKENYISKETPVIEEKKEEPKDNGIDILSFDS